jgi:hypothetical protein
MEQERRLYRSRYGHDLEKWTLFNPFRILQATSEVGQMIRFTTSEERVDSSMSVTSISTLDSFSADFTFFSGAVPLEGEGTAEAVPSKR